MISINDPLALSLCPFPTSLSTLCLELPLTYDHNLEYDLCLQLIRCNSQPSTHSLSHYLCVLCVMILNKHSRHIECHSIHSVIPSNPLLISCLCLSSLYLFILSPSAARVINKTSVTGSLYGLWNLPEEIWNMALWVMVMVVHGISLPQETSDFSMA